MTGILPASDLISRICYNDQVVCNALLRSRLCSSPKANLMIIYGYMISTAELSVVKVL